MKKYFRKLLIAIIASGLDKDHIAVESVVSKAIRIVDEVSSS